MNPVPTWPWLDPIADAINPLLGAVILALWLQALSRREPRLRVGLPATLMLALVVAYGLTCVERELGLFRAIGLDFSTHGAVHWAAWLAILLARPGWWPAALGMALAYHVLMWAQGYHGALDLLLTALAIGPWLLGLWHFTQRRWGASSARRAASV